MNTTEFFNSRGIGSDSIAMDFITGDPIEGPIAANIAAYVRSKKAGEHIVDMFQGRARLDYREHEPNYIQVKVGVNVENTGALQLLHLMTQAAHCFINKDLITAIKELATSPESKDSCNYSPAKSRTNASIQN